jgi:hypothetical protein
MFFLRSFSQVIENSLEFIEPPSVPLRTVCRRGIARPPTWGREGVTMNIWRHMVPTSTALIPESPPTTCDREAVSNICGREAVSNTCGREAVSNTCGREAMSNTCGREAMNTTCGREVVSRTRGRETVNRTAIRRTDEIQGHDQGHRAFARTEGCGP